MRKIIDFILALFIMGCTIYFLSTLFSKTSPLDVSFKQELDFQYDEIRNLQDELDFQYKEIKVLYKKIETLEKRIEVLENLENANEPVVQEESLF